jgi:serine phosphatase RsbU (regulator of sigma subunit)
MNRVTEEHLSTADFVATGERMEERREALEMDRSQQPSDDGAGPLLPPNFVQELRGRWDRTQTGFVDEPRKAVQEADELVASAMKRIAESFAEARNNLERQWDRGDEVSTEDLRIALRKYRAFFQRLLAV